jgi:ribosomal protein S27AE
MPLNTCLNCGGSFEAATKRRSYCAGKCFRAKERAYSNNHRAKYSPERLRAIVLVGGAIAKGELQRAPCETCGSRQYVEAHHDDYAKPFDVRWLCKRHHRQHHVQFGPALNAFRAEVAA